MQYVIGDVHGCNKSLNFLLDKLQLNASDSVYFVGDLVDRGPDSKGVVDTIIALKDKIKLVKCCRGNHEQLMMDSIKGGIECSNWIKNGGEATLRSFGIQDYSEIPAIYACFFSEMKYYIELPEAFIVHAGFDFQRKNFLEDTYYMMWTRNHYCDPEKTGNRPVIHGHTPVSFENSKDMIIFWKGDINIDNGCVYIDRPDQGRLTAVRLDDWKLISVENRER